MSKGVTSGAAFCKHRERAAIDLALARGVSPRALARRFKARYDTRSIDTRETISRRSCVPSSLPAPIWRRSTWTGCARTRAHRLLGNLVALRHRLFAWLDAAEEHGDGSMVARARGSFIATLNL